MLDKLNWFKPLERFLEYPKEFNPRVHGPYSPSRYYGKADTAFGQVKLGDFGSWLARRDKSLVGIGRALGRASWRYREKYILPKRSSAAPIYHFIFVAFVGSYLLNEYSYRSQNGYAKYH